MRPPSDRTLLHIEERCLCGNLLAKVSAEGIEIRCRRCKRTHSIPWPGWRPERRGLTKSTLPPTR